MMVMVTQAHPENDREVWFGILQADKTCDGSWILRHVDKYGSVAKAGLLVGDEICFINGTKLESIDEFLELAKTIGIGNVARIRLIRDGKKLEIPVKLRAKPKLMLSLDEVADVLERKIAP